MEALQKTWILLMLGLGLLGVILGWLAFLSRPLPLSPRHEEVEVLEYPEDRKQMRNPVPPVMWVIYALSAVGMAVYVIWAALAHPGL